MLNKLLKTSYMLVLAITLAACGGGTPKGETVAGLKVLKEPSIIQDTPELDPSVIESLGIGVENLILDDGTKKTFKVNNTDPEWNANLVTIKAPVGKFGKIEGHLYTSADNGYYPLALRMSADAKYFNTKEKVAYYIYINNKYVGTGYDPRHNGGIGFPISTVNQDIFDVFTDFGTTNTFRIVGIFEPGTDGIQYKYTSPEFKFADADIA